VCARSVSSGCVDFIESDHCLSMSIELSDADRFVYAKLQTCFDWPTHDYAMYTSSLIA